MTYDFLVTLYNNIMTIAKSIVIKRDDLAKANETLESLRSYDEYIACLKGEQDINNIVTLRASILAKYVSPDIIGSCLRDRRNIPKDVLSLVIKDHINYVIEHYEEQNEYYRMLSGLPSKDDYDLIFISGYPIIPQNVPIHQLSLDNIAYLESKGVLQTIQKKYPDKPYLHFLGLHKIDLVTAREAKPFQILRSNSSGNSEVDKKFEEEYYKARQYVMIDIYNRNLFVDRPLYEPMMGFLIVTLAIRNTLVPTEDMYLNFEEILDSIFESYGIKAYFENFPFTYKKKLVLLLDSLYQRKGTDGIMIDICKLFSNDNLKAKRYYYLKTYAKDENGELILDENDPNRTYDLKFLMTDIGVPATNIREKDIIDYESVVENDYLWQMTPEETEKIKKEEFNLMMSKYVSVEAVYDFSELTYEVCFFVNLLLSSRNATRNIMVPNIYSLTGSSDCFTMLVFMFALFARRCGFDGNLVFKPAHIAQLWGFNLEDMSDVVRNLLDDDRLSEDIQTIFFDSNGSFKMQRPLKEMNQNDCVKLYVNNRQIFDELNEAMRNTNSYIVYTTLSKIKKILFVSCMNEDNFRKADGTVASTYLDLLIELDPKLYDKVLHCDEDEFNDTLLYAMEKLEYIFNHPDLRFLFVNTPNSSISILSKYIRTTIEVFKAAAVQLETINIFFNVGGEHDPIRVFDEFTDFSKYKMFVDQINVRDSILFDRYLYLEDIVRVTPKYYQF